MTWRKKRQIIVLSVLTFLLISFFLFVYFNFFYKPKETISPPPFLPLKIYPAEYIVYNGSLDIIGEIENPNQNLTLKKIKYQFLIYDENNLLREKTETKETILTNLEKKYLTEINYKKPNFRISKVELNINYDPFDFIPKNFEKLKINYYNINVFEEGGRKKLKLTVFNEAPYPLKDIELIIFLYQAKQKVAVLKTIFSLNPEETKEIILSLPDILAFLDSYEIYFQRTNLEI